MFNHFVKFTNFVVFFNSDMSTRLWWKTSKEKVLKWHKQALSGFHFITKTKNTIKEFPPISNIVLTTFEQSGEENKIYNILFSTFSFPRKQSKVKRVEKNTGEFKGHNDETKTYGI